LRLFMDAVFRAGLTLSLIDKMTRPLSRAQEEISQTQAKAAELSERLNRIGDGMQRYGQGMAIAGGVMTGAFAAPIKFAADFESSMADVNKVADFSKKQYQDFSSTLLDMSERIPMAAGELSQLAAAGAQMGIPKKELAEYTEMVSKLGVAFDMPAGQIGDAMGKLSNVFDLPMEKTGLLGDAINYLSNNMAAAAPDIVNALARVGGTAANIGLAAEQTAALSSALIAQGEAPERAGTALNIMMVRLSQINTQSKSAQEAFSELGFNATDFAARMRKDPLPAIMDFLERARETGKAGEYMSRVLGEEAGARIVKLANNYEGLEKSLGMVADESLYAGSAQKEFQERVSTFNSQMQLLWNTAKRLGITLGTMFLPALTGIAKTIQSIISPMAKFAEQHKILAGAIFGTIGVLGIFTLVGGGVLMMLGFMANGLSAILALQGKGVFSAMLSPLAGVRTRLAAAASATWTWVKAQGSVSTASSIWRTNISTLIASMGRWIAAQTGAVTASSIWTTSLRTLAVTAATRVWSGIVKATKAVWAFNSALLTNPVTLLVAIMVGAAMMIYKYWDYVRAFFSGFFKGLAEGLAPLMPLFKGLWSVVKLVLSPVADLFSWLGKLLAPAEATQKELSGVVAVGRAVGKVFSLLFAPITGLVWVFRMLRDVDLGIAFDFWRKAGEAFWGWIKGFVSGVVEKLTSIPNMVTGAFTSFSPVALIAKGLNRLSEWLFNFSLFEAGQKIMNSLWEGIKALASKPVEIVKNVAQKIRDFLPFSPAKMGPLADIHKTGGALMNTMAAGIRPDPVSRRMKAALDSAKKAVPAAAMSASLALTPAIAGGMPQLSDMTARAQYMTEAPAPPQIPDLSATARWRPELAGMPQLSDMTAKVQTVSDIATPRDYPEITRPDQRAAGMQGAVQIHIGNIDNSRGDIYVGAGGGADEIERILDEDNRELEDRVYEAVVRALERRRRTDFGG
jgi:TP901 family phage tail tape measure protein